MPCALERINPQGAGKCQQWSILGKTAATLRRNV